jgi:hypothetical protein
MTKGVRLRELQRSLGLRSWRMTAQAELDSSKYCAFERGYRRMSDAWAGQVERAIRELGEEG